MKRKLYLLIFCISFLVLVDHSHARPADSKEYRDPAQRRAFVKANPCPSIEKHTKGSCPGFVVDHIKALACGGLDRPENMQWQTVVAAKAKDKWELKECGK